MYTIDRITGVVQHTSNNIRLFIRKETVCEFGATKLFITDDDPKLVALPLRYTSPSTELIRASLHLSIHKLTGDLSASTDP